MTHTAPPPLLREELPGGLAFDLLLVEGGEFLMGGADEEATEYEKPIHRVGLSSFYLGKYPVTQAVWQAVIGGNPSRFKGENLPVETVSWNDVQVFLTQLNSLAKKNYRLPTEAEWEFAARGGIHGEGYLYAGSDKLKQVGWCRENSYNKTHDVGQKLSNELGLYDMSGNVYEWCHDWYGEKYYEKARENEVVTDPHGPVMDVFRVVRGGSFFYFSQYCRNTSRYGYNPDFRDSSIGFRLALSLDLG